MELNEEIKKQYLILKVQSKQIMLADQIKAQNEFLKMFPSPDGEKELAELDKKYSIAQDELNDLMGEE